MQHRLTRFRLISIILITATAACSQANIDGLAPRSNEMVTQSVATATGGRVKIISSHIEDATVPIVDLSGEPGMEANPNILRCDMDLTCVDGWDLRVQSVRVPAETLAMGGEVLVTAEIQNRGRADAPVSELQLCLGFSGACFNRLGVVHVPSLRSGESASIKHLVRLPNEYQPQIQIVAIIDPDGVTAEVDRRNNRGNSEEFAIDGPALQWLSAEISQPNGCPGAIVAQIRLRNRSVAAGSEATEIAVEHSAYTSSEYRFPLPAIGPRQTYEATLEIQPMDCHYIDIRFRIDPDQKATWGFGHEAYKPVVY